MGRMEIQDIPHNVITEINLNDFNPDEMWHVKRLIYPHKDKVYFFSSNDPEPIVPYNFLGRFNLNAKIGDTCRLIMKTHIGYPDDDPDNREYWYTGFYMWEGIVTELILRESVCRIGSPIRKVLFEKAKNKPQVLNT
jgi:hypothetical protein